MSDVDFADDNESRGAACMLFLCLVSFVQGAYICEVMMIDGCSGTDACSRVINITPDVLAYLRHDGTLVVPSE